MTETSPTPSRAYDLNFARWVATHVDGGERLNMCMQCGVCSGSCPLRDEMDFGPRQIFQMVRAGRKEEVLKANTHWHCVSCYNCIVRCPREVPVKYILHGLAHLAVQEGYAEAKDKPNHRFARAFQWSAEKYGRTDERLVAAKFYFSYGLGEGIKRGRANQKIAMGMIKTKRMHLGMPHKIKRTSELQAIIAKAKEIQGRAG